MDDTATRFLRRRVAGALSITATTTSDLEVRADGTSTQPQEPSNTIAEYHTALNGVNQPQNLLFKDTLWWTLGILAIIVILVRAVEALWARLRQVNAMSVSGEKQAYWRVAQWSWMPGLKKHMFYAPLWKKRHNREFRLSSAGNIGTLPSRLHTIILSIYVICNFVYMFVLGWDYPNRYELCAELRGRSGTLSLVNMVPLIILAGRNNPLISLLKVSFDTFNLIHRWLGRLVVIEALVHTIAWAIACVADVGWSGVGQNITTNLFVGSGTVGTFAMVVLLVLSFSPVRHAFYETFLDIHIILALVAFIATWVHCASAALPGGLPQLPWIITIVVLWFVERFARMLRLVYANWSSKGFTVAVCETLPGQVTRVTLQLPRYMDIQPGTHAYLRFQGVSVWENHPFSIAWVSHHRNHTLPVLEKEDPLQSTNKDEMTTSVTFLIGAQTGMTRKLYNHVTNSRAAVRMKAAMEGPYAGHHSLDSYGHAVLIAGATGITYQLMYIRRLLEGHNDGTVATRRITLVWIVREYEALEWVRPFMDTILRIPNRKEVLRIQIFVTRPQNPRDVTSASNTVRLFPGRPNIPLLLQKEVQEQVGAMCVTVCGPGALADDVRSGVRSVQGRTVVDFVEESFTW